MKNISICVGSSCHLKGSYKIIELAKDYIANQLKKDKESEQLSIFDRRDPFTGSK